MIQVKLTFPYPNWPLVRQTPHNSSHWKDCFFDINPEDPTKKYDYYFVFNYLLRKEELTNVRKGNVFLITPEPSSIEYYDKAYCRQFAGIITSQKFLNSSNKIFSQQSLPWFVDKSYDELKAMSSIEKSKCISIIASNKARSLGHRKRLDLALQLKDYFKDRIDLYGRGINPFESKWSVLAPYKYTLAIENSRFKHYFTEKLSDAFLAFCYPLYIGAPNIKEYFRGASMLEINSFDLKSTIAAIEPLVDNDLHYDTHLEHVKYSRDQVLDKYNLFPMIYNFIKEHVQQGKGYEQLILKNKEFSQHWSKWLISKFK